MVHETYFNPFHKDNSPKIHDGKVPFSLGTRHCGFSNRSFGFGTCHIIVQFPGISNYCSIYSATVSTDNLELTDFNHVMTFGAGSYGIQYSAVEDTGDIAILTNTTRVHQWRLVSAGFHIEIVSSEKSMSGMYEHFTFTVPRDHTQYYINTGVTKGPVLGSMATVLLGGSDRRMYKSYSCGTLKQLSDIAFKLPIANSDHEMKTVDQRFVLEPTLAYGSGLPDSMKRFLDDNYDYCFNCTCTILHNFNPTENLNYFVNTSINFEVVYLPEDFKSIFHTRNHHTGLPDGSENLPRNPNDGGNGDDSFNTPPRRINNDDTPASPASTNTSTSTAIVPRNRPLFQSPAWTRVRQGTQHVFNDFLEPLALGSAVVRGIPAATAMVENATAEAAASILPYALAAAPAGI